MTFSSCLTDEDSQLVLDSSVVINLLATGQAARILAATDKVIATTDSVIREISRYNGIGRQDARLLSDLIVSGVISVVQLDEKSLPTFFDLVSGDTTESLGDGEAATLAFAFHAASLAVIDEKKATRLSTVRFPTLRIATTIDILAYEAVQSGLGKRCLSEVVLQALRAARMQVREHQFAWITEVIGAGNVSGCPSLRRLANRRIV